MNFLARIISTGCGIGYFPLAPGTMGALAALIIYWVAPQPGNASFLLIIFLLTLVGIYAASITERELITRLGAAKGKDPKIVIIDEIIGMLVSLIAIPKTKKFLILAFILFRIFDIIKPFPARRIEKLPAGWGIVFDDVIAGIYANLLIQIGRIIF
jgi:phosphatidylglycerophosphatase A